MMATASGGGDYDPDDRGSRFRGLDNYTDFPKIQSKKPRHGQVNNEAIDSRTGFILAEKTLAEFFIVERIDSNKKTFEEVSPFFIEKALTNHIGDNHETKRLRNGSLLVKCKNDKQAKQLLGFNNILFGNSFNVKVTEHATLNTVQGVVYCVDTKFLTEDEILAGLANQKVVKVQKIKKKVGNDLVDTALCIITFKRAILPTSIKFGFYHCLVKAYIPNPLRCLNCFRYGHTRKHCKRERICSLCSDLFHDTKQCATGSRCINCTGEHTNWNKDCPRFKREVAIQTVKTQEKISYHEAKKKSRFISYSISIGIIQTNIFQHIECKRTNSQTSHPGSRKQSKNYIKLKSCLHRRNQEKYSHEISNKKQQHNLPINGFPNTNYSTQKIAHNYRNNKKYQQ